MVKLKVWLGILVGVGVLGAGGTAARSDADYDQALKTAPQGIALENVFTPGTAPNNQAQVVDVTNPNVKGTQAARVSNGKRQYGALWSTNENVFDLTQDHSASMWMYFGNTGKKAADGMALVFQNDDNGLAASPKFGKTISGETLGVWGVDNNRKNTDPGALAALAIQNSWALEFDTHLNNSTSYGNSGDADSFDVSIKGPHIASNYPGAPETYEMVRTVTYIPIYGVGYYATQAHAGLISGDYTMLANGAWHHLSLNWSAKAQEMTYTFDDKDPLTGEEKTGTTQTVPLDLAKIDPKGTNKVRWGFTGATGESYENNLVLFEEVPGLVDATAKTKVTDTTTGKTVGEGESFMGTHNVQVDYQLDYFKGKQAWKKVEAQIQLPDHIDYQSAKITYSDGTTADVSLADLSDNQVRYTLTEDLSDTNKSAVISFTGKAEDVKGTTPLDSTVSTFAAVNGVVTTSTPSMVLNPTLDLYALSLSGAGTEAEAGEDVSMRGLVVIPEGLGLGNSDMTVKPKINGENLPDFQIPEGEGDDSGVFTVTVPAAKLKSGRNKLTFVVGDPFGNLSNEVTYTIDVNRQLLLQTGDGTGAFADTMLTGTKQKVRRLTGWQVEVLDTREAGAKWSLQVTGTDFKRSDGTKLAGNLFYFDRGDQTPITDVATTVGTGTATDDDDLTDVAGDWDDDQGLMLELNSAAVHGDYEAQLTWTLNDVPS
ncbi:hypothetical protein FD13_GL000811 [Levilactobacillus senmaizukei DSM 21775 = NBRC 103853]|uniref:WxL domain-containing protein n=1 Tax=Levilactobacillus senmaizukei DSM 21775 = NBRC 103853 TaxID=1423803 RepID=A0A0R2DG63_9LACO|nr:hypothetical protein [Levilactobacillus senmaizukei]KRN03057.1 hypothetical protein FD13_GL000811 [Levilactobacillus senmaizukei DSM 21775 = NBRC 103853]